MPLAAYPRSFPIRHAGLAAITADWSSAAKRAMGCTRAQILINVSAVTDTPSVVFQIEAYDKLSNAWFPVAKSAAVTGTGQYVLTLGPGQNEVDDVDTAPVISSNNGLLPPKFRLTADGPWGGTDAVTFTAWCNTAP